MHLRLATEAEKHARDALTHAAWGSPLSVPEFQRREARLRAHPWTRAGMQTWLLADEGSGEVLCSCETFHNDSFLRLPDGGLQQGDSGSIASVYTEPRLRGRGHARTLMDLLARRLEGQSVSAHAAVLFSDVGPALYARSGYRAAEAWDWRFPPLAPGAPQDGVDALLGEGEVAWALARMRRPEAHFFLWPSAAQVDWHLERERFYAEALARPRPTACGARVGDSTALWAMVARSGKLAVLMLDARSAADCTALLAAARRTAAQAGLGYVEVWEEPHTAPLLPAVPHGQRLAREESLPMLRPLRPGLPPVLPPFPRALWV